MDIYIYVGYYDILSLGFSGERPDQTYTSVLNAV